MNPAPAMLTLSPAALFLAPLAQHKGRLAVSVLAIALGVALGYAVQLINAVALNEFSQAVRSLAGEPSRGSCCVNSSTSAAFCHTASSSTPSR